ncbi:MAG: hypothetical protein AAGI45_23210 [Cyanobacteria bacterium P01_H01_bin.26]
MAKTETALSGDTAQPPVTPDYGIGIYSNREAGKILGKSLATIKRYKRILVDAFGNHSSEVVSPAGRLTEYGIEQLKVVAVYFANGTAHLYKETLPTQRPDLFVSPAHCVDEPAKTLGVKELNPEPAEVSIVGDEPLVTDLAQGLKNYAIDLRAVRGDVVHVGGCEEVLALADQFYRGAGEVIEDDIAQRKAELRKVGDTLEALRGKHLSHQKNVQRHQAKTHRMETKKAILVDELKEQMSVFQED